MNENVSDEDEYITDEDDYISPEDDFDVKTEIIIRGMMHIVVFILGQLGFHDFNSFICCPLGPGFSGEE